MYSGSAEFNNLIEKPGGNALKTRFTFSDFSIENFTKLEYYGGSNNSNDIAIGTTNMAYLEVGTMTDRIITNREFLFEVGMELSDGTVEYAPMGYFTVQKPDSDEDEVNFTAYDRMQKFEKPYKSNLEYPTDSQKILYELCTMCEVQLATPILNPITITDKLDGYTCREVLGYIAGIHGLFACFDRYGKLNVRWYRSTPIEKQIGLIWSLTKSQSDFTVEKVTLAKDSETTYTSGSGGSRGINHSNPYATFDLAKSLYARLGGYTYRPCEISMLDDIRLDAWDTLKVTYLDGSVLTIPVMSLEHSFTSGETRVKSFGKTDTESEYRYSGPTTQAMDRMATELLVVNRVVATKVDAEYVNAHAITTDNLSAIEAEIKSAVIEDISAEYADIRLANIDTANIDVAKIGSLFAEVGLIDSAIIKDGHITGYLDSVEINADKITAGTIVADRIALVMRDEEGNEKGLIYALNNLGELTSENIDTIDGNVITPHTIGADHIIAGSITSNEIATATITADKLASELVLAQKVVAENLEIIGGNINIQTSETKDDVIKLIKSNISENGLHTLTSAYVGTDKIDYSVSYSSDNEYRDGYITRMTTNGLECMTVEPFDAEKGFQPAYGLLIRDSQIMYTLGTGTVEDNVIVDYEITPMGARSSLAFNSGYIEVGAHLLPSDYEGPYYFGSSVRRWKYGYFNNINAETIHSTGDVIANLGGTNQVSLSDLAPSIQSISSGFANGFTGNIAVHDMGEHRDLQVYLTAGKALSAGTWYGVYTFSKKPLSTCRAIVVANTNTYIPVVVELQSTGLLRIYPRAAMAKGNDIRFTLSFAT